MTSQETLTKAIELAIKGGFSYRGFTKFKVYLPDLNWIEFNNLPKGQHVSLEPYSLIFNHQFAQALWGKEETITGDPGGGLYSESLPEWEDQLQQMVIAPDPIAYLAKHLPEVDK